MGWPFSTIVSPSFDSGFVTVPSSLTNVPNTPTNPNPAWLMGLHLQNTLGQPVAVTLNDGTGAAILSNFVLAPNEARVLDWDFMPIVGALQWSCDTASAVNAKAWGYK